MCKHHRSKSRNHPCEKCGMFMNEFWFSYGEDCSWSVFSSPEFVGEFPEREDHEIE